MSILEQVKACEARSQQPCAWQQQRESGEWWLCGAANVESGVIVQPLPYAVTVLTQYPNICETLVILRSSPLINLVLIGGEIWG